MNTRVNLSVFDRYASENEAVERSAFAHQTWSVALTTFAALTTTHFALWLMFGALGVALGSRLSAITPVLSLVCAVALVGVFGARKKYSTASIAIVSALFFMVWVCALLYASLLDDLSFDGQGYHALALLEFRQGWNPFRNVLTPDTPPRIWLNHYPKAPWIWAASIDAMFGSFQASKASNVVLAAAAGAAVAGAAATRLRVPISLVLGALAAANPVASVQLPTMYVDGQLASLLTIMASGAFLWILHQSRLGLLIVCSAIICVANIKFTGAVYMGLFAAAISALGFLRGRRLVSLAPLVAFLFAMIGPGYAPYLTNLQQGHHIFYPVVGDTSINIMKNMAPSAMEGHSALAKLAYSLAAETANSCQNCEAARLKLPFTVRLAEAQGATFPDPRTGGFGPLFSAALLLTVVLFIMAVRARAISVALIVALALIIGSVLINPEAWWARYVPQLWLVPLIVIIFVESAKLSRAARGVRYALLVVLVANAAFMAVIASGYAAYRTQKSRSQVAMLAKMGPLSVREKSPFGWFGTLQRLHDGGVVYREAEFKESECRFFADVIGSELQVCAP